jgi:hypothetical protein
MDRSGLAKRGMTDILNKYVAYVAVFIWLSLDDYDRRFSYRDALFVSMVGLWDIWTSNWSATEIPG